MIYQSVLRNKTFVVATFSLVVASLAGCTSERPLREPASELALSRSGTPAFPASTDPVSNEYRPLVGGLPVQNGALDGSIGHVDGLRLDSEYETSGWGEPRYASIYTTGWGENGAAMTVIELEGGLNHADLVPGARLEYDLYDPPAEAPSLFAYVVGCAGDEMNTWSFDQVADHTIIDVSTQADDPDVLVLDYHAEFTDWETGERSSVVGSVDVVRTPN